MSNDVLSVRLPLSLAERLDRLSISTKRARSHYVRQALEAHIGQLEWEQRIANEVEGIRSGHIPTRPMSELASEYGIDLTMTAEERDELLAGVE